MEREKAVAALTRVIVWLHPRDVATLACTCSALAAAAALLTRLRISDAARGLEHLPVPIINTVDHILYPFFSYSPSSLLRAPLFPVPWGISHRGKDSYSPSTGSPSSSQEADYCPCFAYESCTEVLEDAHKSYTDNEADPSPPVCKKSRQQTLQAPLCGCFLEGDPAYDSNSRLRCVSMSRIRDEDPPEFLSIMECGPSCCCSQNCKYRVTQHGLCVKVAVYRDHLKGWGLRAMQFIAKGSFAFEYAGELLTTVEAQDRQQRYDKLRKIDKSFVPSLLVLREHLPSGQVCLRLNIDATQVGNVARFVNHSCDGGNLQPCLVRLSGCFIPKLVFFARRDIIEGEELTFSYGNQNNGFEKHQCFCETASCKGFLPFEET